MYTLIFSLLTFLIAFNVSAYENDFSLKTGFVFSSTKYGTLSDDDDELQEEETETYGVMTDYGYKWKFVESGIFSRITLGKAVNLEFNYGGEKISGRGNIRNVDITPYLKFNTPSVSIPKKVQEFFSTVSMNPWYGYFRIGPSWVLQTINLDGFNVRSEYRTDHKLTYESFGVVIALGLEEDTKYKEMHPAFIEVSGSAYESYKVSLVDKSNSREINILGSQEAKQDIKTFSLMVTIGVALF